MSVFWERNGFDPQGAVYKLVWRSGTKPLFTDIAAGVEKKTRLNENNADLQALVTALNKRQTRRPRAAGGERLRLLDGSGEEVLDFTCSPGWQPATFRQGAALVISNDTPLGKPGTPPLLGGPPSRLTAIPADRTAIRLPSLLCLRFSSTRLLL